MPADNRPKRVSLNIGNTNNGPAKLSQYRTRGVAGRRVSLNNPSYKFQLRREVGSELAPSANQIRSDVFRAAGADQASIKPKQQRPNKKRLSSERSSEQARRQDSRRGGNQSGQISQIDITRKLSSTYKLTNGSRVKTGAALLRDKELRPLYVALAGDISGILPIGGAVINWVCIFIIHYMLKKRGISLWKSIKARKSFELNAIGETLGEAILFYPGLTIFTYQALTEPEKL